MLQCGEGRPPAGRGWLDAPALLPAVTDPPGQGSSPYTFPESTTERQANTAARKRHPSPGCRVTSGHLISSSRKKPEHNSGKAEVLFQGSSDKEPPAFPTWSKSPEKDAKEEV